MKPIERLLQKNKFDWVNSDITDENFPGADYDCDTSDCRTVEMPGDYKMSEVTPYLEKQGLRPCTPDKLLRWVLKNPDVKRKNPIVAFGQTCRNSDWLVCVLVLFGRVGKRYAALFGVQNEFYRHYRVLAEPKEMALEPPVTRNDALTLGLCPHCNKALPPELIVKEYEYLRGLFVK